jgi:hypothetical protein
MQVSRPNLRLQRIPTFCGVSECDPWSNGGCRATKKKRQFTGDMRSL